MTDQPEALRLANVLQDVDWFSMEQEFGRAAAELHRLHAENKRLRQINQSHEMKLSVRGYEIQIADLEAQRDTLKAERDALKAAAEKGTEYVLAHINQDLKAERDALLVDAERYRWLRRKDREFINDEMSNVGAVDSIMVCVFDDDCDAISFFEGELDAAIDAARSKP